MKKSLKITGILLMLLLAGNVSLNAQSGMRGMADSTRMNRMRTGIDTMHRRGMYSMKDSLGMRGMRSDMGPGSMHFRGQFMNHPRMYGMGRGMGPAGMRNRMWGAGQGFNMRRGTGPGGRMGRGPMGPESLMLASIPNVTEKQKKEITDLRLKQQDEMKKLREEMTSKMQALRESHRKSMLNILTPEQQKFIESKRAGNDTKPAEKK